MGNRSFLYAVPSDGSVGGIQIAEANNNFPTLWQILLAEGETSPPITDQRVFGDANTDNLSADAEAAYQRLSWLADQLSQHPRLHEQPLLLQQFDALRLHLRHLIDSVYAESNEPVRFSANLDELSWLSDQSPEAFIQECRNNSNARWQTIVSSLTANRFAEVNEALGLTDYGMGFESWQAWAWNFGFSGIEHDYFHMADAPRELPFADFTPEPREWENHLEDGFERFEQAGLWGVRWQDQLTGKMREVLAPEWDNISWATNGAIWLQQDGFFTYARLNKEGIQPAFSPQLTDVWNFFDGENLRGSHCAIVQRGELQGLLNADGSWLLEPSLDEIWSFEQGFAPFRSGEKYGFVNHNGQITIAARFDDVSNFSPSGLAPVWENDQVGLIDTQGSIVLAPTFEQIEWRDDFRGFLLTDAQKIGLAFADGRLWVTPQYDELKVLITQSQIAARQGDLWGMLNWEGEEIVPPRFHDIETRYLDDLGFDEEAFARLQTHHKECIVRIDKQVGLMDATGHLLIPISYDAIESLTPQTITSDNSALYPHRLVFIVQRGAKRKKLRGVYDLATGKEWVACEWHHILHCQFDDQQWGFLVGLDVPKADRERLGDVRTGMLTAEGKTLFPPDYAWIGKAIAINGDAWLTAVLRKCIGEAWSINQPVQAVPSEANTYVWLYADGRVIQHIDYLLQSYEQTGELEKALEIGRTYRDGIGVAVDSALARQWLWRATGAIEMPTAPSLWKKLTNKLGRQSSDQETIPSPQATPGIRHPRAMYELALMLQTDQGGPVQADTAREWLRFALENGGKEDGHILAELGYLLSEGIGGKEDREEGCRLYEAAIAQHSSIAMHNLGLAYQYGRGVAIDLPRALTLFRQAESAGDESCAYHIGAVLTEEANLLTGDKRRKKYSEAAYAFSKIIYKAAEHSDVACAAYAQICLDPDCREYNPSLAEEVLLQAAAREDLDCITMLIENIYGNPTSGLQNPEQRDYWQLQKAALEAIE